MNNIRLYVYLGGRDKRGVRVLTVIQGSPTPPTRLTDLNQLQLPDEMTQELKHAIYENRMNWEPWIESASDYQQLRESLSNRGYSGLPIHGRALYAATNLRDPHKARTEHMSSTTVMLQKPAKMLF